MPGCMWRGLGWTQPISDRRGPRGPDPHPLGRKNIWLLKKLLSHDRTGPPLRPVWGAPSSVNLWIRLCCLFIEKKLFSQKWANHSFGFQNHVTFVSLTWSQHRTLSNCFYSYTFNLSSTYNWRIYKHCICLILTFSIGKTNKRI